MRLLGGLLLGVGILVALVSGVCALVFLPEALDTSNPYSESMAWSILFVGGIPFVIGVGLILLGRHLLRRQQTSHEAARAPGEAGETEGDAKP